MKTPDVEAINLDARLATFDDGGTGIITDMFDADGEDTADPEEAVAVVIEHKKSGRFFVGLPEDFDSGVLQ
jgi:hypothetical protein